MKYEATSFNCNHLFGMRPTCGHVSLYDVRDAFELASLVTRRDQREALYACYGLDIDRVESLYPTVDYLNRCYYNSTRNTKVPRTIHFGPFKITLD
jgi:hypothetical protein